MNKNYKIIQNLLKDIDNYRKRKSTEQSRALRDHEKRAILRTQFPISKI